nr:reverse transcriptase domain-containing protein [Tanacetum cinerariifolium]
MTRQKVTQSFAHVREITFPPLATGRVTECPFVIEAEIGGHMIRRIYVDGGSSTEVLYEHCFNRLWLEIKSQMVLATTLLTDFSGETIWPLGQLRLLKKRGQAPKCVRAIQVEVQKLVEAGIIREVYYNDWLSNPVMKSTRKLNFIAATPLSVFWTLTKAITKYRWQNRMKRTDFHTSHGVYCYTKMTFGLKNIGATYQRLVDKAFDNQVGRNIEVYIDDLVIKSHTEIEMLRDIDEMFCMLRQYKAQSRKVYIQGIGRNVLGVLVEVLKEKSIQEKEVATVVEKDGPTWMTPIMEYLKDETPPDDRNEASKLRILARQYKLLERVLYKRSFLNSWLRCVGPLQADYVIREIHKGSCSMHVGPQSVVAKSKRLGYYWPTMHQDTLDMILKSGPFPEGPGKVKFLIVAMDYFTNWIEAKAVATITGSQVKKFMWDNIVCRFGLPGEIVSDNVKHPQSNGLMERENRSLGEGIKARLGEGNKNWIEDLPHVLWAHRTMINSSYDDTPFSLTYGTKAVIPAEIEMPTYRTAIVDVVHNDEELRLNLDLLEERRERAAIHEAKAKLKMTKYYNARVQSVTFRPGDFVYRRNQASHVVGRGKLGPKWEGPYEVTEALRDGAYMLRSMDGTVLSRTWNIANLKKCY